MVSSINFIRFYYEFFKLKYVYISYLIQYYFLVIISDLLSLNYLYTDVKMITVYAKNITYIYIEKKNLVTLMDGKTNICLINS